MNALKLENKPSIVMNITILNNGTQCKPKDKYIEENYLFFFMNLSVLLEALILHEKIVVYDVSDFNSTSKIYDKDLQWFKSNSVIGPFIEKGLLEIKHVPSDKYMYQMEPVFDDMLEKGFDLDDAAYADSRIYDFYQAKKLGVGYLPDLTPISDVFIEYMSSNYQMLQPLLIKAYNELSKRLESNIHRLKEAGSPKNIFIPPITAIILDQAKNYEQIGVKAIALRDELAPYRKKFTVYEKKIKDDSLPIKESLSALDSLEASTRLLLDTTSKYDLKRISEWKDLSSLIKVGLDEVTKNDAASLLQLFLGKPLSEISNYLKKREIVYLSVLKNKFMNLKDYGKLVDKTFNVSISRKHFNNAKESLSHRYHQHLLLTEKKLFG